MSQRATLASGASAVNNPKRATKRSSSSRTSALSGRTPNSSRIGRSLGWRRMGKSMSIGWYSAASGHPPARAEPDLFVLDLPTYRHGPDGLASADAVDGRDRYAEALLRQGWRTEFFEESDLRPNLPGSRCEGDGTDSTPSHDRVGPSGSKAYRSPRAIPFSCRLDGDLVPGPGHDIGRKSVCGPGPRLPHRAHGHGPRRAGRRVAGRAALLPP